MARKKKATRIKPGVLPARFAVFFDGCCEPRNPGGTAGYGVVIHDSARAGPPSDGALGARVWEHSGIIPASPTTSNNVAEYLAVVAALEWLREAGHAGETIHFFGDSMLVVAQIWGDPGSFGRPKWKIHGVDVKRDQKPGRYAEHAVRARELLAFFKRCDGFWIPRAENGVADDLSKAELRRAGVEFRIQPEEALP